jgi:hypothetical protein
MMGWFSADGYWLSRFAFLRALAVVYAIAFLVARNQFRPLLGEHGILPIPRFVATVPFRRAPSVFHVHYSDRFFAAIAWVGLAVSLAAVAGVPQGAPLWASMLVWSFLWVAYLSIVNVGQTWYGFGWETLLLETGFLAIFLGPSRVAPPVLVLWLLRWLLFRVEFGAGLIKLRGDRCWRDLTCLRYHHETQPLPNPASWWFHHLPMPLHKVEVLANHFTQLVVPVLLFAPQPVAGFAALVMIVTQCWLLSSGNFAWLNVLTITLAIPVLGDGLLHHALPFSAPAHLASPAWWEGVVVAVTVLILALSYRPARNLVSRRQLMNASFDQLHLVNTYGAFGGITRVRHEVVVEGTADSAITDTTTWHEYGFRGKPGDLRRRPPQVAPYHLRLDWMMWFAGISPAYARSWFGGLVERLLRNDRDTLRLLRVNPFPDEPPVFVRALLYRYRFTTWRERRQTGRYWDRDLAGEFLRPVRRERETAVRG